jgi:nucleolar GTP-binding protein
MLKIVRSTATAQRQLRLRVEKFQEPPPSPLEERLLEQRFGRGVLARSLTRVHRAEERIRGLSREEQSRLRRLGTEEGFGASVRSCYGRLASFLREVDTDLVRLAEMEAFLRARPHLETGVPTVVVAGFPNVGKSSLVARLSTAHPEVADYPFTTLAIAVGHADLGFDRMQVVDTPGVLGRPDRMNPAEAEAIATVEKAAHVILFVIDPTESCGYTQADQEGLLARWRTEFPTTPILEVETKSDLPHPPSARLEVSAITGAGIDELRRRVQEALKKARPTPSPSVVDAEPES